jgi:hypothetical protein
LDWQLLRGFRLLGLTLSNLTSEHCTTIALASYSNTYTGLEAGGSILSAVEIGVAGFAPTMLGVAHVNIYAYLVTV